ncbi:MAG: M15 family metallopeptidase [Parasporobacterium sp.]|nr:M15 family metallopeptidase [Parasporobacterium sp.]
MKKHSYRLSVIFLTLLICAFSAFSSAASTAETSAAVQTTEAEIGQNTAAAPADTGSNEQTRSQGPDDPSGFVLITDVIPEAILEVRYYSEYNFVGSRIDGYEEPVILITREAAAALRKAADELKHMGYRFRIFDGYRPQMAVDHFVRWAQDPQDTKMKKYFYPEIDKELLFSQGYIAKQSGHSRGSTLDLTIFDDATGKDLDMGGPFDYFGKLSHPSYTDTLTKEQISNRMLLRNVMVSAGFRPLREEWWHFTLENEPYPETYFTFPVNSQPVTHDFF